MQILNEDLGGASGAKRLAAGSSRANFKKFESPTKRHDCGRDIIRAELTGTNYAEALGITVLSPSPVIDLARKLVAAGHDPTSPLEAWRGSTLCLSVRSIGEAAGLRVKAGVRGSPIFCVDAGYGRSPAGAPKPTGRPCGSSLSVYRFATEIEKAEFSGS